MLESPCDIPDPIGHLLLKFKYVFLNLDTSLITDKENILWFLENMGETQKKKWKEEMKRYLKGYENMRFKPY